MIYGYETKHISLKVTPRKMYLTCFQIYLCSLAVEGGIDYIDYLCLKVS